MVNNSKAVPLSIKECLTCSCWIIRLRLVRIQHVMLQLLFCAYCIHDKHDNKMMSMEAGTDRSRCQLSAIEAKVQFWRQPWSTQSVPRWPKRCLCGLRLIYYVTPVKTTHRGDSAQWKATFGKWVWDYFWTVIWVCYQWNKNTKPGHNSRTDVRSTQIYQMLKLVEK